MEYRFEKDALGEKKIPKKAYWGIHTQRALENFTLTGNKTNIHLVKALAMVKKAAALSNMELGFLDAKKAKAVLCACDEIIEGLLSGEFLVDALQGGAGTSTNMNINEVIANRAAELLGGKIGDYSLVDPLDDVNLHQSTNDVYPTALKIATIFRLRDLSGKIAEVQGAFQKKEKEFAGIVKIARTELQEAVPITLGAEFSAFAEACSRDRWRVFKCEERIRVVNIGGTAVGTGLTAPREYIFLVIEKLRELTGLGLSRSENPVEQTSNADSFVEISGILKAHAGNLIKIANDLRLLHLLGEIRLPALQAGSSIMPGKVNPVICEAVIQAGIKVSASDGIIFDCVSKGSLQLSEFMPLVAESILGSLDVLINANMLFKPSICAIEGDEIKCREYFDKSLALITAFLPYIGYSKANELLEQFKVSGNNNLRGFLEKALDKGLVERVLSPQNLTALGYRKNIKERTE